MERTPVLALVGPSEPAPPEFGALDGIADVRLAGTAEALAQELPRAEVLFVWDFRSRLLEPAWPHARRLRWVQTNSIGVDAVAFDALVASDVTLTNMRGVFEKPIAEWVVGMLLLFAKDMRRSLELQAQARWVHRETESLEGRRMVILGAGPIAREIARLARPFGIDVAAVGRTARDGDADFGRIHAGEDVARLLGEADIVVLALPLTAETERWLDAEKTAWIRPGARLVNVGRGAVVDDDALIAALEDGRIDAAALDVFDPEPLPADHPYWRMERVVVSPHMAGDLAGWQAQAVARFAENLERWRAGDELRSVVEKSGLRRPSA